MSATELTQMFGRAGRTGLSGQRRPLPLRAARPAAADSADAGADGGAAARAEEYIVGDGAAGGGAGDGGASGDSGGAGDGGWGCGEAVVMVSSANERSAALTLLAAEPENVCVTKFKT